MSNNPLSYHTVFSTPWFAIEESITGSMPYYRLTGPDGVIVLPLTIDGEILMIRQFRPTVGRETLELPAGAIDPNEDILDAALREVREETAHTCSQVIRLASGNLHLNRTAHIEHFCLAIDAHLVPGAIAEKGISTEIVSRSDFRRMIVDNRIEQIAALCFVGLITIKLGIDLLESSIDNIRNFVLETSNVPICTL